MRPLEGTRLPSVPCVQLFYRPALSLFLLYVHHFKSCLACAAPHGHWWYCYIWSVTVNFHSAHRNLHKMEDCVLKVLSVYICVSSIEPGRTSSLVPFVAFPEFIVVMLCFYFIWWKNGRVRVCVLGGCCCVFTFLYKDISLRLQFTV